MTRYQRLKLICILEFIIIILLAGDLVLQEVKNRTPAEPDKVETVADQYPHPDVKKAIYIKGSPGYETSWNYAFVGEVSFSCYTELGGFFVDWSVPYELPTFRESWIDDAFRELSENGYDKCVIYGDLQKNGCDEYLVPRFIVEYE